MRKILSISLLLFSCFTIFAQYEGPSAPDYKEIEKNVSIAGSKWHYPALMDRYLKGDSTMTMDEMRNVYYGYVFQPTYVSVDTSRYNNMLAQVLSVKTFSEKDLDNILLYSKQLLKEDPFNMRALSAQLLVYAQLNDVTAYKQVARKRNIVQRAIVSSGDGMTKKTPYYVIKVSHEYDILGFLGFRYGGVTKIEKKCKCNSLTLAPNHFEIDKMYFDITPALQQAKKTSRPVI